MKIIIFGSDGMLGKYLDRFLSLKYDIVPLTRKDIDLAKSSQYEIYNFLSGFVGENDIIINSSGIIKQRSYDLVDMIKVNSIFPNTLADFKKSKKCNVVHISTDCVYSGKVGNYHEDSPHDCLDEYGKTKSLGENKGLTIIRTSIIGEETKNKRSLVEWIKSKSNSEIDGYTNHLWNGVSCLELSKLIGDMIKENNFWEGTRHVFSPSPTSKFDLVNIINEVYGLNITINKKETEIDCFRNLDSIFCPLIEKDLRDQILEMKNFKIQ